MPRGEEAHSTREAEAIESAGELLPRRKTTVIQRITPLSTRDTQRSRASNRSACGLRCSPCTHHSVKCSQLLLNKR